MENRLCKGGGRYGVHAAVVPINFTVSPSFPNEHISDWYIFNTWVDEMTLSILMMHETDKGRGMVETPGASRWQDVQQEDVEFMIDIIPTLPQ